MIGGVIFHETADMHRPMTVDGVDFHPRLVEIAARIGVALETLATCVRQPETSWTGLDGRSTVHLRGPYAVIVGEDGDEALAVARRDEALAKRAQPRWGATRRRSQGNGNRMPTTVGDLLDRLRAAGFEIDDQRRHYVVTHPSRPNKTATVPRTPSDYRSLPNTVHEIKREFGIDVREGS